jgi:hypothetical protein
MSSTALSGIIKTVNYIELSMLMVIKFGLSMALSTQGKKSLTLKSLNEKPPHPQEKTNGLYTRIPCERPD